jgi:hypothetical protein
MIFCQNPSNKSRIRLSDYQIINFLQSVAQTDLTALIGVIGNNRGKTDTSDLIWKKGSKIFIRKKTGQIFKQQ